MQSRRQLAFSVRAAPNGALRLALRKARMLLKRMLLLVSLMSLPIAAPQDGALHADELLLRGGGRIRGEWLNAEDPQPKVYRFASPLGVRVESQHTENTCHQSRE